MNNEKALASLKQGNQRFLDAISSESPLNIPLSSLPSQSSQSPHTIIVSCSDSRVAPELVFACGLGELFVVRVAGNIITPSQLGSIEFACQSFGTRLVVILGHSNCGAIEASVSAMRANHDKSNQDKQNIDVVIEEINLAIDALLSHGEDLHSDEFCAHVEEANVKQVSENIISRSQILQSMNDLKVVGAKYSLATGEVEFFDKT